MQIERICKLGLIVLLLMGTLAACGGPSGPSIQAEDVWARPAMMMQEGGTSEGDQPMG